MRKTFNVKKLTSWVNDRLENDSASQDMKAGYCTILEHVLHETGNYHGFNSYHWVNGGYNQWVKDGKPKDNSPHLGPRYDRIYY